MQSQLMEREGKLRLGMKTYDEIESDNNAVSIELQRESRGRNESTAKRLEVNVLRLRTLYASSASCLIFTGASCASRYCSS